jgi:hypothetical protein
MIGENVSVFGRISAHFDISALTGGPVRDGGVKEW